MRGTEDVDEEFQEMRANVALTHNDTLLGSTKALFFRRKHAKQAGASVLIPWFQQFTGMNAVMVRRWCPPSCSGCPPCMRACVHAAHACCACASVRCSLAAWPAVCVTNLVCLLAVLRVAAVPDHRVRRARVPHVCRGHQRRQSGRHLRRHFHGGQVRRRLALTHFAALDVTPSTCM